MILRRTAAALAVALGAALAGCAGAEVAPIAVWRVTTQGCGTADEISTGFSVPGGVVVTTAHSLGGDSPVRLAGDPSDLAIVNLDLRADVAVLSGGTPTRATPAFRTARQGEAVTVLLLRDGRPEPVDTVVEAVTTVRFNDAAAGTTVERAGLVLPIELDGGDSGAPVVGRDGRVLGMMFADARDSGTAYAVAATEIRLVLDGPPGPVTRPDC